MKPEEALKIFIAGVAALNDARRPGLIHRLLSEDLLAFRAASGLGDAWATHRTAIRSAQDGRTTQSREARGRKLWKVIHRRALTWTGSDPAAEREWITAGVARLIPGCAACRADYDAYLAAHPPVFDTPRGYFDWTVELHNHVNSKLGKTLVSTDEARRIWSA